MHATTHQRADDRRCRSGKVFALLSRRPTDARHLGTEIEYGSVVFIDLQANLKLALYPRRSLAQDAGIAAQAPSATEFSIGHNVSSKAEVDAVMAQAKAAGAVIVKPAQDTFWGGYAGYFQDPDGHLWDIAWNPHWPLPE